jgi:hypothetical protein
MGAVVFSQCLMMLKISRGWLNLLIYPYSHSMLVDSLRVIILMRDRTHDLNYQASHKNVKQNDGM